MSAHPEREILALIAARDAQDSLDRAACWAVRVCHEETQEAAQTFYGPFAEPAAAMAWAVDFRAGLIDGEPEHEAARWHCDVLPIMPVT